MPTDRQRRSAGAAYGAAAVIVIAGLGFLLSELELIEQPPFSTDVVFVDDASAQRPASPGDLGGQPKAAVTTVRLGFVGDIMQHARQADDDFADSYAAVRPLLEDFDLMVGNLEFPVDPARPVGPVGRSVRFNGSPAHLDALAAAGFDVLSTANNHTFDQGLVGALATLDELASRGLDGVGTGSTGTGGRLLVRQVGGLRIGFAAYTFRPNSYANADDETDWWPNEWPIHELHFLDWTDEYRAEGIATFATHAAAASEGDVDLLVALVHWGEEWHFQPTDDQRAAARDMIDAGFNLVVGGHSHVINPPELYRGRLIAYSLGNFISDFTDLETRTGAILEVEVSFAEGGESRIVDFGYHATLTRRQGHVVLPLGSFRNDEEEAAWSLATRILGPALRPFDAGPAAQASGVR